MNNIKLGIFVIALSFVQLVGAVELPCDQVRSMTEKTDCLYTLGLTNLSDKNYEKAIELFSAGINVIGMNYNKDHRAIDDTGLKLTLAKIEENKGNLETASNLYKGVLSSRISLINDSAN